MKQRKPPTSSPARSDIVIAGYRIDHEIAIGGFGTVYRARDQVRHRNVALKILHPELVSTHDGVARFEREAKIVGRIRHRNVVSLHDVGRLAGGEPYFAMELLDGETLRAHITGRGLMNAGQATQVLIPLCDALHAAHRQGVIHRDLKASNIFLARDQQGPRVVLLDFGVAKLLDDTGPNLTVSRHLLGTPPCMAPEQITSGEIDQRTDVYALGVLAFHMLTGELPFRHANAALVQRMHIQDPPPAMTVADVSADLERVVHTAMAKSPADRYPDVRALISAWAMAVEDTAVSRSPCVGRAVAVHLQVTTTGPAAMRGRQMAGVGEVVPLAVRELGALGLELSVESAHTVLMAAELDDDISAERLHARVTEATGELAELFHRALGPLGVHVVLQSRQGLPDDLLSLNAWRPPPGQKSGP